MWRKGDLSYKLDSLQQTIKTKFETEPGDCHGFICSRQIGKSWTADIIALESAIQMALKNKGILVRVLAPTLKQVYDIVRDNLSKICVDAPPGLIEPTKSELRWLIAGKSQLRIGALERAHVDGNRGGNADLLIYEEGGFVLSEDYQHAVESVVGPQLLRSGGKELHISSISEDENHYLHTVIIPKCEALGTLSSYDIDDSPSITPEQRAKAVERCGGEESEAWLREYKNKIIRSKSLMIVPEFNDLEHTGEFDLPEHYNPLIAGDGGGIRDKTELLSVVWDFAKARMLVWDEKLLDSNTATSKIVHEAKRLEEPLNWYAKNPDRVLDVPGQVQVDMINDHSYLVRVPHKDDLEAQINAIRLGLSQGKILIHKRCKHLIGCLKTGRYNDKRTDFERTTLYGHADPIMALVYAYRMVDRTTNPYPVIRLNPETHMEVHYRKEKSQMEEIAKALRPYDPMRRVR